MYLNLRVLSAAVVFLSFHVLIDNVPLAAAKGNERQRAIFYRFPYVADVHGPSPANFRHSCMLVSRDEDGKWRSGKKLECVIWSNSKYNNVLGKMRKRKKGQGSDKKKEIGNDLLGSLFGIFGLDIGFEDTRNNGLCFQLWFIVWTILYTVFFAVIQKVVTRVKSWVSKEKLDSGQNSGMRMNMPLPSEYEVEGEMTSKDAATQTETRNYPENLKGSMTEQLKDLKNGELVCKSSIDNAKLTTEALQVSSKDISSGEGQSISTGTVMQMGNATIENGSFDECPSDSTTTLDSNEEPEIIDIIKENEIKREEGTMYPDLETFLMNVSHFDRFYAKERVRDLEGSSQLETRNPGFTSKWILVDDDLICDGKELKQILEVKSEEQSRQEKHLTSENEGKEPTKLSAQSLSKGQNAVCDRADSFDDNFITDFKTGGTDALTSRLGKALDKESAAKKGCESLCKSLTDESGNLNVENQGDLESIQNSDASDVEDSATTNESRQCKLDEARDNDIGKVLSTVTSLNALECNADYGENFNRSESVVKMQSSLDLESTTGDLEVGQEESKDNPYDFSDVVETDTLFNEESSVTPSDDASSFTGALEDAKYFEKDSKEIKRNGLLYLDGEQNEKPIYLTDCDRQDEVVQAEATEDVLPSAILVESETCSEREEMHYSKLQSGHEVVKVDSTIAVEECLPDGLVDRNAIQRHQCDTAGLENQETDNANTSVQQCEQELLILAESANITEHQTTGDNKDGKRMTSLRQENSEVMIVYRNDSGIDCADNSPLTMTDRCTDSLDETFLSINADNSSLLSVVTKRDDASTCNVDDDSVGDAVESKLASGNDDHVNIEGKIVDTDKEMIGTSTYVESATAHDDKCIANWDVGKGNGNDVESNTQKTQNAEEDHGSEPKLPTLSETRSESTLMEENNEVDDSLDANLREMFWGEIFANYNPQQLMENFELLRGEMNKEENKAECIGVASNALLHQSNEVPAKSATEKNKDTNAASKDAVIPLSQNTHLSLLMDTPLRNGSAMVRRVDPLKAMRFWLP